MGAVKKLFLIVLCLNSLSCSKCKEDKAFKAEFQNCLEIADLINGKGYYTDFITRCNTFECLIAVSGYRGHVDFDTSFHGSYRSREELDRDLKVWEKWYEDNKYSFTLEKADSLIWQRATDRMLPDLTWPVRDSVKVFEL
ncbi:hypothetical protein [uncultured Alistipes sp.]|uniref:hypothetical protein n=1 Tax=uncultured Alistipes sp. TaxID=538949 RepID=UPI0025CBAF67|nr:hypothetical protein [uncultured Alistipes sp.]